MKKFILSIAILCTTQAIAQTQVVADFVPSPLVDFEAYLELANEVYAYRQPRVVSLLKFNELAQQENTVILDTRSDSMYMAKHVKGAIHLNFADFTAENLRKLIPDPNTRILIYCNNNFMQDIRLNIQDRYFMSKGTPPKDLRVMDGKLVTTPSEPAGGLSLALNIPTFINLYGYGYRNVYELGEMVQTQGNPLIRFESKAVERSK